MRIGVPEIQTPGIATVKAVSGIISLTLPYPPTANTSKFPARMKNGALHMKKSNKARDYHNHVQQLCLVQHVKPLDGPVKVLIRVFRPRKRGDLGSIEKVPLDALSGFAYHDDEQIEDLHLIRYEDKENPRIEVSIERIQR